MKSLSYTNLMLTIIAFCLLFLCVSPFVLPKSAAPPVRVVNTPRVEGLGGGAFPYEPLEVTGSVSVEGPVEVEGTVDVGRIADVVDVSNWP